MSTTSERLGEQARDVKKDLQGMGETVKDAAREKIGQVSDKVLDAKHTLGQFIRELPVKSVLIALGAGILLGTFWTIRRR